MKETVAVIGLGRVGLPLALYLAHHGCEVHGIDNSPAHLATVRAGRMAFLEEGAQELLSTYLNQGFAPTADVGVVRKVQTIIVTLGTAVDEHNNPIFLPIENLFRELIPYLQPRQLIVLRSTVSPGTTEHLGRLIEQASGFRIGSDLFLAFCPERIAEGRSLAELPEVPQIVGGLDPASTEEAARFFRLVTPDIREIDARGAELAKLFCNMYRYIDFAVANEFMIVADQHDRDIHTIVEAINTGYKRGGLKTPGLTGGPCLYKDGFFLTNGIPFTELIASAWKINETVPAYLVERAKRLKRVEGSKVAVLGLAFKKNIDDPRNSLSYKLRKILLADGADVHVHDPFIAPGPIEAVLRDADLVFIAMNHDAYRTLSIDGLRRLSRPDALVCDIWNLLGTGKVHFLLSAR